MYSEQSLVLMAIIFFLAIAVIIRAQTQFNPDHIKCSFWCITYNILNDMLKTMEPWNKRGTNLKKKNIKHYRQIDFFVIKCTNKNNKIYIFA